MEFATFDPAEFGAELAAAAQNHHVGTSVLLENERVRIWDLTVAPGERVPFHSHEHTYFFVCTAGGRMINRFPDGNLVTIDMDDGFTWYSAIAGGDAEIHDLENVGATTVRFVTVELL